MNSAPSTASGDRAVQRWLLVAIAGVSLIHLWHIGSYSFWFDEIFSLASASEPSMGEAFRRWYTQDQHPPLYNAFLLLLAHGVGMSELAMRLPSWLFVTIASLFLATQRIGTDRRIGPVAGLLLAVTPLAFVYSQEARSYGLLAMLSAITVCGYTTFTSERRVTLGLLVGAVFMSWTHIFGHIFAGTMILFAFVATVRARAVGDSVKLAVAGALCWAWIVFVVLADLVGGFFAPAWATWSWSIPPRILMHTGSVTMLIAVLLACWATRQHAITAPLFRSLAPVVVVFGIIIVVASFIRFVVIGRYFTELAPAMAIMAAEALVLRWDTLQRQFSDSKRLAAAMLLITLAVAENVVWMYREKWGPYQNYRDVARYVADDIQRSGNVPPVVSIVSPIDQRYQVRQVELWYLRQMLPAADRLPIRIIESDDLPRAAAESTYVISMHIDDVVAKSRDYLTQHGEFHEIEIPTSHPSMTFLAKRAAH